MPDKWMKDAVKKPLSLDAMAASVLQMVSDYVGDDVPILETENPKVVCVGIPIGPLDLRLSPAQMTEKLKPYAKELASKVTARAVTQYRLPLPFGVSSTWCAESGLGLRALVNLSALSGEMVVRFDLLHA